VAVVRPFRAVTFSLDTGPDVSARAAPPYDVISAEQRAAILAREPHNVVELELPAGAWATATPDECYRAGAATWRRWRDEGVLVDDKSDALYLLEQRFTLHRRPVTRRAIVAAVDLEPFSAGVVLPHERTLPKALGDRLAVTRACAANLSQVLGLYLDPAGVADELLDPVRLGPPMLAATDSDGVHSLVWAVRDQRRVASIAEALAATPIFIADGHHRYTTALAYRDERRTADGRVEGDGSSRPSDSVMMALVNMDDPELIVLPTHRVADAGKPLDETAFLEGLERRFELMEAPADPTDALRDLTAPPTFVVRTRGGRTLVARLRPDVDVGIEVHANASRSWKSLDVVVLQELILWPLLGIHPDCPETLERLSFVKDDENALAAAKTHDVAFLLRPTRMDQLRAVALSGEVMPQKSTYFYPKLLSGLLMRDLA
jgi:uncharacterized protein (DUF1015 family)